VIHIHVLNDMQIMEAKWHISDDYILQSNNENGSYKFEREKKF
jgi:hypothetical protein